MVITIRKCDLKGKTEKRVPYRKCSIYRRYAYVHPEGTLNKFLKLDVIGYL